jgi:hypothetical protein
MRKVELFRLVTLDGSHRHNKALEVFGLAIEGVRHESKIFLPAKSTVSDLRTKLNYDAIFGRHQSVAIVSYQLLPQERLSVLYLSFKI